MQVSNNIQVSYPIEFNDLNNTTRNTEQVENINVQDTEDPEAVSVVELSRVDRFRNSIKCCTVKKIITASAVFAIVASIYSLISLGLPFSEGHSNKEAYIGRVVVFSLCICLLFFLGIVALRVSGVVSKCLHKRKIQNPIIKELKSIKYKNIEQYQGNITEFYNKPSVIKLEELGSEELRDPIIYKKQLSSFKEFKKAIKTSNGIVPHDKLIVDPQNIRKLKIDNEAILEDLV